MSQQRRGSGPAVPRDNSEDDVFDAKTVVRSNPSRPPPLDRPSVSDDTPVPPHQPLAAPFEERTMVAPRRPTVSQPPPRPLHQPSPAAQAKVVPLGPKQTAKALGDEEGSWNIQKEETYAGTQGGISSDILKKDDRNRLLLRGLAVFAALMILTLIIRKCGKGNVEPEVTNSVAAEPVAATGKGTTSTEALLQDFDQAFLNTQTQTR